MGADLYINKLHDPNYKRCKTSVDFWASVRDRLSNANPSNKRARALADRAQTKVTKYYDAMYSEGYFRDSYNATSVLQACGLSWWRDVTPMLNKCGNLSGETLKKFRAMVAEHPPKEVTHTQLKERGARVTRSGPDSVKNWNKYYQEKHADLLAFLDTAIKKRLPVHCSL